MNLKNIIQYFIYTYLYLVCFQRIWASDPFNRLRHNQKQFIASINNKFDGLYSPTLFSVYPAMDSTINISSNTIVLINNNIPNVKTGILLNGMLGDFSFFIEPIIANKIYGLTDLGTEYSRQNISGRIENAFIRYHRNNFTFSFGRSSVWWGQSISRSIILSGLYPSFEHLLFRYRFGKIFFDLLCGQLGSRKTETGYRIKRNIGGHRLIWKIDDKISFSIGEQVIYTGLNRNIELIYLNPFVPYFFTGLEGDEEDYMYDNDNSIIFADFRYMIKPNLSAYSEIIIDDYQIDDTKIDDALGLKIGFDGNFRLMKNDLHWVFEWTKIDPWTYIHHGQYTTWEHKGHPIGFSYGADSECIQLKLVGTFNNYNLICDFNYLNKGKNNLDTKWDNSSNSNNNGLDEKYLFTKVGVSVKNKFGRIETGWVSKDYINSIIINQIPYNQYGMFYIELILEFHKRYNLNYIQKI